MDINNMQKRFISTSTHILDPANPSTPPVRPSPPPTPPTDVPDPNDKRSLFDKLADIKAKKQEAFEEAYKFSNQLKRLDDNESDFLTHLQQERNKEEQEKKRVEDEQVDAFKRAQSAIEPPKPAIQDIAPPPPPIPVNRRTSSSLRGAKGVLVKRKSESQEGAVKRRRSSITESPRIESPSTSSQPKPTPSPVTKPNLSPSTTKAASQPTTASISPKNGSPQGGLAGFDQYSDSDSE